MTPRAVRPRMTPRWADAFPARPRMTPRWAEALASRRRAMPRWAALWPVRLRAARLRARPAMWRPLQRRQAPPMSRQPPVSPTRPAPRCPVAFPPPRRRPTSPPWAEPRPASPGAPRAGARGAPPARGGAPAAPPGGGPGAAPGGGAGAPAPAGGDIAALGGAALAGSAGELRSDAAAFVDPAAIRIAAEGAGLRFPDSVYANVAAGLGAGKRLLLAGAPGAGKTSLALAVARAAAQAGRANGATLVTASRDWAGQGVLVESAKRGRWVILDELDRAQLDDALGGLSSFLAGLPVQLPGGDEATPDGGWRIVATAARAPEVSPALLRRFAVIEVLPPAGQVLVEAIGVAARGDVTAAAAVARLVPLAEVAPLGAGVFIDAARHAAARHASAPAIEATLARDAYAAYIAPLLGELDADAARRVREIVGEG